MTSARPLPTPTATSRPYWDAAQHHRLEIQRCRCCRRHVFYPRTACPHCSALELEWVPATGRGTVYTYTVVRRPTRRELADLVPYVVATIELEEGPRITSNLIGCPIDEVKIAMPVEVTFEDFGELALPLFRPTPGARRAR